MEDRLLHKLNGISGFMLNIKMLGYSGWRRMSCISLCLIQLDVGHFAHGDDLGH